MKERGIIFLAVDNAVFFYLAYNAAASIRVNNKDVPITLFYDPNSNIPKHIRKTDHVSLMFDELIEVPIEEYVSGGKKEIGVIKSDLYFSTPYDKTIFIDADSQITQNFDISEAFKLFENSPLWFNVDKTYSRKQLESDSDSFQDSLSWVNFEEIKERESKKYQKYPQLGSFFHGFKKGKKCNEFFQTVKNVQNKFLNNDLSYNDFWHGMVPDEAIFISSLVKHPKLFRNNNEVKHHFFCDQIGTIDEYGLDKVNDEFMGITYSGDEMSGEDIFHYEKMNRENFRNLNIEYKSAPNYKFSLFRH